MRALLWTVWAWGIIPTLGLGRPGLAQVIAPRLPSGILPRTAASAPGTWTPGAVASGLSLLLTDGSVLQQPSFSSSQWQRIVPDASGQYHWSSPVPAAPMHDTRGFFPSVVTRDGRVFVAGGEYGSGANTAEIYDPVADVWTTVTPTLGDAFYDCSAVNLPDGRIMILVNGGHTQALLYDPAAGAWSQTSSNAFPFSEVAATQMPGGAFLAVSQSSYPATATYLPATDQWIAAAPAPSGAAAFDTGGEGTKALLYDGRIMAVGQTGNVVFYTPGAQPSDPGSWSSGFTLPDSSKVQDAFSVVMANGHVLFSADQGGHNGPTRFYDYDPLGQTIVDVSPVAGGLAGPSDPYMALLLPTGDVFVAGVGVYTPTVGGPQDSWRPTVSSLAPLGAGVYRLTGTQLCGLNEGAYYGDDAQMSTNYPLLRLTSSGGAIIYARTSNFSTMALATGAASVTADFTLPALADGNYLLEVVTNAVASLPTPVEVRSGQLVLASLPKVNVTAPPGSTGSSPLVVTGTASGASPIHQVTWSNAATGTTGTATGTTSWTATIGLAPGTNPITITATDGSGASSSTTFVVTYTGTGPAPSPASGGGGGGGCGCLGLEALLCSGLAALLRRVRRRPRGSPGDRAGRTSRETEGLPTPPS